MEHSVETFVDNGGVSLACERRGKGARHVVFAHGWISSRRMWYDVAGRLDPDRYTLHLLDFRGCGASDRPRGAHAFESYVSDLRALLDAIGEPVVLAGHSMGGRVAQWIAAERASQVERLVLVAPGSARPLTIAPRRRALALDAFGSRRRIEPFLRAVMKRRVSDEVVRRLVDDALVCQDEHWFGVEQWASVDFSGRLAAITAPALVLAGANDPLASPGRLKREVAAAIHGSLFVVLKDAGHNLPVELPGDIAAAIERF